MALNIKNPEAHTLAQELSDLTGESMSTAVTIAVRERRDRMRAGHAGVSLTEQLLAIGRDCAARLPKPIRQDNYDAALYDEHGLPA